MGLSGDGAGHASKVARLTYNAWIRQPSIHPHGNGTFVVTRNVNRPLISNSVGMLATVIPFRNTIGASEQTEEHKNKADEHYVGKFS